MRKPFSLFSFFLIVLLILILSVQASPDTETLRPNAAGTYQEWETLVDTSHWGATSDDTDATYIKTTGSSTKRDIQNLADSTFTGATDINVTIKVRIYVSGSGAPEKINLIGYDNVNNGDFTSDSGVNVKSARGVWTDFTGTTMDINPVTEAEWTQTEIDGLEAGLQVQTLGSGEYIQCSEIWVVVDYTVGGQNYVADLDQSISFTWDILTETDYNIAPSQSLTTSWSVLTEWDAIADLAQSISSTWDIVLSHGMFVDLSQSIASTWQIITSHGMFVDLSQSVSTSWEILIQSTFNVITTLTNTFSWIVDIVHTVGGINYVVDLSQAVSTTWSILTQWNAIVDLSQAASTSWEVVTQSTFNIVTSLSNSFSWIVDIVLTVGGIDYVVDLSQAISTSWMVALIKGQQYIVDLTQAISITWHVVIEWGAFWRMQVSFEILIMLNVSILFTIAFLLSKELRTRLILGSINIVTWFTLALAFVASQPSFPVFAMIFFVIGLIFAITLIHESISMFKEKRWKTEMD